MASCIEEWLSKIVGVITCDGRVIVGELRGYDQLQNLILCNSHERVFSTDAPVELVPLGLYVIRGDNIVLIYEIDENLDSKLDLNTLRAKPLKHVAQYVL
mmetsp:Transcript_23897/g.34278  ORF Transcript_23897/g.34278 Transcript_23897/m.34278 type:complete len:100 (-) Transcript_23897:256-555(-)|eukprot:CAMPEP_0172418758 /NCGR_PEP_ID=MMETSP1064-20121228/5203_1 /TAXON_ID=202472 /ORGANISM="Aulacoseira subarctica , Strain CCAP 1002/5" /LENGTH=99 /DNA_ID=CAMNT_0013157827 /DNA_START=111 /DNA_END=410 /DNA_ORIENTATION=+